MEEELFPTWKNLDRKVVRCMEVSLWVQGVNHHLVVIMLQGMLGIKINGVIHFTPIEGAPVGHL